MPKFTPGIVKKLVENKPNEAEIKSTFTFNREGGPDRCLDLWKCFVEGEDAWLSSDIQLKTNNAPTKIIISDPYIAEANYFVESDLRFWDFLIETFEVYLWQGEKKKINDSRPLHDLNDLMKKRSSIIPASQKKVEQGLAQQGIAIENFIIFDLEALIDVAKRAIDPAIFTKRQELIKNSAVDVLRASDMFNISLTAHENATLKLNNLPNLNPEKIINCVDANYKGLCAFPLSDLDKLNHFIKQLPNAKFQLIFTLDFFYKKYLKLLEQVNGDHLILSILYNSTEENRLIFSKPVFKIQIGADLKKPLHIKKVKELSCRIVPANLTVEESSSLTSLLFTMSNTNTPNLIVNFQQGLENLEILETSGNANTLLSSYTFPKLQQLELKNEININLPQAPFLEKLILRNCINVNLSSLKNNASIQKFNIHNGTCDWNIINSMSNLEELVVEYTQDVNVDSHSLKTLTLKVSDDVKVEKLNCPNLEYLSINKKIISDIIKEKMKDKFPKLKELKLENATCAEIDLSATILKNIHLENCTMRTLNVNECQQLENLTIPGSIVTIVKNQSCTKLKTSHSGFQPCATQYLPNDVEVLGVGLTTLLGKILISPSGLLYSSYFSNFITLSLQTFNTLHFDGIKKNIILFGLLMSLNKSKPELFEYLDDLLFANLTQQEYDELPDFLCNVVGLTLSNAALTHYDFKKFKNLKYLSIDSAQVNEKVDILNLPSTLISLTLTNLKQCEQIDLRHLKNLKFLSIKYALDLEKILLPMEGGSLIALKIQACPKLEIDYSAKCIKKIELDAIKRATIDCSNSSVNGVWIRATQITANLENCRSLTELELIGQEVNANIDGLVNLQKIKVHTTQRNNELYNSLNRLPSTCEITHSTNQYPLTNGNNTSYDSPVAKNVSIFSFSSKRSVDNRPGHITNHTSSGSFNYVILNSTTIDKAYTIIEILNDVAFEQNQLTFIAKSDHLKDTNIKVNKHVDHLSKWNLNDTNYVVQRFSGKLDPNKIYPLPCRFIIENDKDLDVICKKDILIFKDETTSQYFVKLKKGKRPVAVEIFYRTKKNTRYETFLQTKPMQIANQETAKLLPKTLLQLTPEKCLPKDILDYFRNKILSLPKDHPLNHVLSFQHDPMQYLFELAKYCDERSFKNETLTTISKDEKDNLWQIIFEQKGACRHRAEAFVLLARLAGIPANAPCNGTHMFVLAPFVVDGKLNYLPIDLGGAPSNDLTPASLYDNVMKSINIPKNQDTPKKENEIVLTPEEQFWYDTYYNHFDAMLNENKLLQLESLFDNKQLLSPLIKVTNKADILPAAKSIIHYLKAQHQPYIFINSPSDFQQYLRPYRLEKGKRTRLDGPLLKLIQEGGTMIVNWTNFTPNEIASFKSILDEKPTLLNDKMNNTKVINITNTYDIFAADTLSRCKKWEMDVSKFPASAETVTPMEIDNSKYEVDLFNSPLWREPLLGTVMMEGTTLDIKEGKLLDAIKNNSPLMIYNPPDDDAFNALLFRIRDEKRFLYNGEMIDVPPGFTITIATKQHDLRLDNVEILKEAGASNKIFLGNYNLHQLTETLCIDNNTKTAAVLKKGLLDQYNPETDCFYVTESLPQSQWEILIDKIKNHCPDKKLRFALAPTVTIPGIATSQEKPIYVNLQEDEIETEANVIVSNDPDYYSQSLKNILAKKNQKVQLIDLSNTMSISDILYKIDIADDGFQMITQDILNRLLKGETVILNGDLTYAQYQQLLPLLEKPGFTFVNGEKVYINGEKAKHQGRLICVLPPSLINKIHSAATKNYQFDHFIKTFHAEDKSHLEKIQKFRNFISKLPHRGPGRPEVPKFTHARVSRLLNRLKQGKLHANNPVKGLLLYDYPFKSEDYCYLNVVAKTLFYRPKIENTLAKEKQKFLRLLKKYNIHLADDNDIQKHIWKLLNSFSGDMLQKCLGDQLENVDASGNDFPKLTNNGLAYFKKLIHGFENETLLAKQSDEHKPLHQLQTLLDNADTSLIILKGPPGSGKSYTLRKMQKQLKTTLYDGEDKIIDWLESKESRPILLLDEGNMALPGKWDFLKGIREKVIYYKNKAYPLSDHHKIVVTCNPEHFPGRYYHSLFQTYGETIEFKATDDELVLQQELGEKYKAHTALLLSAYYLIGEYQPHFSFSRRDLENLARRALFLLERNPGKNDKEILLNASLIEFAGMIPDVCKRTEYMQTLAKKFNVNNVPLLSDELHLISIGKKLDLPSSKAYLYESIIQDLDMREAYKDKPEHDGHYKTCLLIEGGIGLGKSTLLKKILKEKGISKNATDPSKKYYQVSAGTHDARETLIKAFREGSLVILDELNADKGIEELLNQLLCGEYKGEKGKPGFMVLGTQNPTTLKGRFTLSEALKNRIHFLYMNDYNQKEEELIVCNEKKPIAHPNMFMKAHAAIKAKNSDANSRTLFTALRKFRDEFMRQNKTTAMENTPVKNLKRKAEITGLASVKKFKE